MAAAARKVYEIKGHGGEVRRFSVGTIVARPVGDGVQRGVIIRILPRRGDDPTAWVAYDKSARVRTWPRTPEARAQLLQEAAGRCVVEHTSLYWLKPLGQAKRLPKCVLTTSPGFERPAEGHWVRAVKPPRRKTPRERREETQASLREFDRKARQSREGFPIYKVKHSTPAKVAEDYARYAHWEREYAKGNRAAIVKHNATGALRRQWLAEAAAHERRARRAEGIVARLRGEHLVETAIRATRSR